MDEDQPPPAFLTLQEVLDIHQDQIERYGGESGILNRGHLDAALAQPQATWGGRSLYGDLFEMAAAYLFHLVQNHAFVDGNKRVGTIAAIVFLSLNGFDLDAHPDELERVVLSVARGEMVRDEVAHFLRQNCVRS